MSNLPELNIPVFKYYQDNFVTSNYICMHQNKFQVDQRLNAKSNRRNLGDLKFFIAKLNISKVQRQVGKKIFAPHHKELIF